VHQPGLKPVGERESSDHRTPPQSLEHDARDEDDETSSEDDDFNDVNGSKDTLAPPRKKMGPSLGKGRACVKCRARKMVRSDHRSAHS